MSSTVLDPLAAGLVSVIESCSMKGHKWAPRETDSRPAGVVELPDVRRVDLEAPESQLGSNDWTVEFPVALYFDLGEPGFSQGQAAESVEAFIKAVDASLEAGKPLNNLANDVRVVESTPTIHDDESRPFIRYACRVQMFRFV